MGRFSTVRERLFYVGRETPSATLESREVKELILSGTASGGSVEITTSEKLRSQILEILIRPESLTTSYKIKITETETGIVMEAPRATRTGQYVIVKQWPVYESALTFSITESSADELFTIKVRYL